METVVYAWYDVESDIRKSKFIAELENLSDLSVDELAEISDSKLTVLIDKHCPVVKTHYTSARWLDGILMLFLV